MLCCAVLCCAVLCCAVLCCAVLCCAVHVLCCAVLCCAVLCCAVLCCAVLCCAVLCCAVLCCAVLCCAVLCCAVLCCAYRCSKVAQDCANVRAGETFQGNRLAHVTLAAIARSITSTNGAIYISSLPLARECHYATEAVTVSIGLSVEVHAHTCTRVCEYT